MMDRLTISQDAPVDCSPGAGAAGDATRTGPGGGALGQAPRPVSAAQDLAIDRLLAQHARAPWRKTCACCGAAHDLAAWLSLRLRGHQIDAVEDLELRDCPCGSTLAVVVLADGRRIP